MQAETIIPHLPWIIAAGLAIGGAGVFGWIHTTRLKIKHGYPLEGMWGQSLKPTTDGQTAERVTLLTQENAQLRAEVGAMKDRLANVERIVTDSGFQVNNEIEKLRDRSGESAGVPLTERQTEGNA
ncbi:hypothetical protein [Pontixanthobacter sp. CEM42]|uniref:hypothetical protein n=1 Tax=Pontixanthobacter sp. CEM42 TaxID=2792077 RepID=UPI001AE06124|nr:hypothetical protein [Pontixanthobacter sp. CEM42]